mgnify:FL=1
MAGISDQRVIRSPSNEVFQKKFVGSTNSLNNQLSGKKALTDFDHNDVPHQIEEFSGKILLPYPKMTRDITPNPRTSFKNTKISIKKFSSLHHDHHGSPKSYDQEVSDDTLGQGIHQSNINKKKDFANRGSVETNKDFEERGLGFGSLGNESSNERMKLKNSQELARLLNVKIDQEKLMKKILQSAPAHHQENRASQKKHASQASLDHIKRNESSTLELAQSTKRADSVQRLDYENQSQFCTADSPLPSEIVQKQKETHILPPLITSNSTNMLQNFVNGKESPQKKRYERKFELQSHEVSQLAKDLLYNGLRRINFSKLLNNAVQPNDNLFKDSEEKHYEAICKLEAKRVRNKKSQNKYDYLMRMDISRKMVPLNNAVNAYKVTTDSILFLVHD